MKTYILLLTLVNALAQEVLAANSHLNLMAAPKKQQATTTTAAASSSTSISTNFHSTGGQDTESCAIPLVQQDMYLTPKGSSLFGQWGYWELPSPDNLKTSHWSLDFLSMDWQNVNLFSETGTPAATIAPTTVDDLQQSFGWNGDPSANFSFMDKYITPALVTFYKNQIMTVANTTQQNPAVAAFGPVEGFQTLPTNSWSWFAITDCEGNLIAALAGQNTDDLLPGRMRVYDPTGTLAADVIADPVVARYQFVDANEHLLATAEAIGLGMNFSYLGVPRRPELGNILPYALHYELGGYSGSSQLLEDNYRWIIAAAVQVRSLMDAHYNWQPALVANGFFLLAVFAALLVIAAVTFLFVLYRGSQYASSFLSEPSKPAMTSFTAAPSKAHYGSV
jgi:hypothetical protein